MAAEDGEGSTVGAPRVLIVDDHSTVSDALAVALRADGLDVSVADDLTVDGIVAQAADGDATVVLLDLVLETDTSVPAIAPLVAQGSTVAILTGMREPARIGEALELGASAVLYKTEPFAKLLAAIQDLAANRTVMDAAERDRLIDESRRLRSATAGDGARIAALTPRELVVLQRLLAGRRAEAIAAAENVSVATIRSHIRGVLTKLGVSSQLAAVAIAREAGVEPDPGAVPR
jgi:DNA-binding NarL/FixJ family response regulator